MSDTIKTTSKARVHPSSNRAWAQRTILLAMGLLFALAIELMAVTVSVTEFSFSGQPGDPISDALVILNGEGQPVDVDLQIVDWDRAQDGITRTLNAGTLERSCAAWIRLSAEEATLVPDSEIEISLDIHVPETVQGTYWTGILISARGASRSVDEGCIKMLRQFLVRIFVTVSPSEPDGRVSNLQVLGMNPLGVEVAFANTGDTVLAGVSGLIAVESSAGTTLFEIPLVPFDVLPGYVLRQSVLGEWGLQVAGIYLVRAVLDFGVEHLVAGQFVLQIEDLSLSPIGTASDTPTDLNGDGLYEDVNGDGTLTADDADLLEGFIGSSPVQDNSRAFDFSNDGEATMADVYILRDTVLRAIE
jgi:PKD repeat protein